ncbi:MAG: molybdenum cofactor biosynthesis protein B [Sphingobium sp.]|nr:molybdenum cofactor biosynthesis protein B [Sphingobium sp.]
MPIDENLAFKPVHIALLTVSDTRDLADDRSGDALAARIEEAGHVLKAREISKDNVQEILAHLHRWIDAPDIDVILTTGGTGVTGRDVTPEALEKIQDKPIPGFGELFRWISFGKIGTSTIQSRACACVARGTYIFALPGSTGAVKDGWDEILVHQLDSRFRPCNFVELMPRLLEK